MLNGDRLQNAITAKKMNGKIFVTCVQSVALYGVPDGEKQTHDHKLKASLCRSRNKVLELAYCNSWEWFITITFDKQKVTDRYNVQQTMQALRKWLNNYKSRKAPELKYLLIPELHKDGAVHVHGLINGLPKELLKSYRDYDQQQIIANDWKKLKEAGYYNWLDLEKKFGRNSMGEIKSHEGVSYYMTKYISKDMVSAVTERNLNTYYASTGLQKAEKLGIYDSQSAPVAALKWDWQDSYTDTDTGEIIQTSTYKKTFEDESQFTLWLKINGIKLIQSQA